MMMPAGCVPPFHIEPRVLRWRLVELHHCDLKALQDDCQKLHTNGHGLLQFGTLEPHLHVELKSDSLGHLKGVIVLRPDPVYEKHEYVVEDLDLSYLPHIISECKDAIITHFPETVKTK